MQNYITLTQTYFTGGRGSARWDDRSSEVLIRTGSVQIKPWLLIAHARACFYFNVVVNKQIIKSFTCIFKILFEWSGGGTAVFCPEPFTWVTEQNKDEAQCGFFNCHCKMVSLLGRNPRQASLTRDILLREVKLFGFMKKRFNLAMSKPTVLFIFYI